MDKSYASGSKKGGTSRSVDPKIEVGFRSIKYCRFKMSFYDKVWYLVNLKVVFLESKGL